MTEPSGLDRQLERRIKRHVLGRPQRALVRFPKGMGDLCAAEVAQVLAAPVFDESASITATPAAIEVADISFRELAALALRLTTAREMLWPLAEKRLTSKTDLRDFLAKVPWELYLPPGTQVSLRVSSTASRLYHETMIKELGSEVLTGLGYEMVATGAAAFAFDLRLLRDRATLSMSLAAAPLHRRGYKTVLKGLASVKEDLAAGAVRLALGAGGESFRPDVVFVPFAGSGTLAFEALMALGQVAPATFMPPLSVEQAVCMPAATRAFLRKRLTAPPTPPPTLPRFTLVELDPEQAEALATNVAGFNERLQEQGHQPATWQVQCGDVFEASCWPTQGRVLVLLNPPYGDRLSGETRRGDSLYARLGQRLQALAEKTEVAGSVFAPTAKAADAIEAKAPKLTWTRHPVSHGGRPIFLLAFCSSR